MASPKTKKTNFHSAPKIQCLKRNALERGPKPTTFMQWMKEPNNIYVSTNLKKYYQNADERHNRWGHNNLSYKLFSKQIDKNEFMSRYTDYIKKEKWGDLDQLKNKVLGCWCDIDDTDCHARILQSLYRQKKNEEFFNKTKKCEKDDPDSVKHPPSPTGIDGES